jgi:hypothetical protein
MSETTARFALPFILPGQRKRNFTIRGLAKIDLVRSRFGGGSGDSDAALAPQEGQAWIVGAGAAGAWTGKDGNMPAGRAAAGGFPPRPWMSVWNKAGPLSYWSELAWSTGELPVGSIVVAGLKVVGERQSAVPVLQAERLLMRSSSRPSPASLRH